MNIQATEPKKIENGSETESGYLVSKGHSWYVFSLLFMLYMFDYMDRTAIASLFPFLKQEWGIDDMQCGMLASAVHGSICIFAFPVSILVDRWSRKYSIGIMAALWSVAIAACAFTRSFPQLLATRAAIGMGEAGYAPGGTAMISALFPKKQRAQVLGFWNAAIPLGSLLGVAIGGFIATHFGWRHVFGVVALPGFLVAILFMFIKDYKTVDVEEKDTKTDLETNSDKEIKIENAEQKRSVLKDSLSLFAIPSLVFTYFGFAGNMFVNSSFLYWFPSYYNRMEGLDMGEAGLKGGAIMATAIIGAPLGGFLVDRWYKKNRNARLLFASMSSIASASMFLFSLIVLDGLVQYVGLCIAGCLAAFFASSAIAVTQDVVHPGLRATSYSFSVIVMNILGSVLGPTFVGKVSDMFGLKVALSVTPVFMIVAGVLFFIGSRFYLNDVSKVAKVKLEVED